MMLKKTGKAEGGLAGVRTYDLPARHAQPGASEILITILPPAGSVFNGSVPFELHAKAGGTAVDLDPQAVRFVQANPAFPHAIPARLHHGSDAIDIDIIAYTCDAGEERVCCYQHARLNVPVTVDELADDDRVVVTFELGLPEVRD
jgi:hypothetical protein